MSAKQSVEINGFFISPDEVRRNGALAVASNRLKGSGRNPTDQQIQAFASDLQKKFSEKRPVVASVSRF